MKPLLRKSNGLWLCELAGWITGIDYTAAQAYEDWLTVNAEMVAA